MASANEAGDLKLVAEDPYGRQHVVWSGRSDGVVSAGFSPDGVLANKTADKQLYLPVGGPVMSTGWKVRIFFKLDAADGLDVSDGVIIVPLTFADGSRKEINATDLGHTTDFPASTVAAIWHELGTGYTIPAGSRAKLGGGRMVISVEDDTG